MCSRCTRNYGSAGAQYCTNIVSISSQMVQLNYSCANVEFQLLNLQLNVAFAATYTTGGTAGGAPCVFPFTYRGRSYTTCTTDRNNDIAWCSTAAVYASTNWGNCVGKSCLPVLFSPCKCIIIFVNVNLTSWINLCIWIWKSNFMLMLIKQCNKHNYFLTLI